jgi:hypothetical protein
MANAEIMTLEGMMRLAENQARTVMVGSKAELTPAWLLITEAPAVEIFVTPWGNDREKRLVIETMRLVMKEKRCTAYSMLTEAWMLRIPGDPSQDYTGPPPSQHKDRQECVVLMAANKAGEHRYQTL